MLKADFERVLSVPPRARSPHFAIHHLASGPSQSKPARYRQKLFTEGAPTTSTSVDNEAGATIPAPCTPSSIWLGTVVPKRHARRAVTRTLLKRQIRAAISRHATALDTGLWVVRLRAPFDVSRFPSAASETLKCAARDELDSVLARAAQRR